MKTLFVLRHAKSSWDDPLLADFERPLNERGLRAAPFMGKYLKKQTLSPSLIISSPATRARQTAELVSEAGEFAGDLTFDGRIYEASTGELRQVISEVRDDFDSVMIVGHNPAMEGIVRYFGGKSEAMPTAAIAVIDLDVKRWSDLDAKRGTLRLILRPKELTRS